MLCRQTGQTVHLYGETRYAAKKWTRKRRVIMKAEVVRHPGRPPKNNPRFVVTNLPNRPQARVSIDYHIELHGHYYSVPYALIHEHVDAHLTATTVEIFHRGQRVAAHRRSVVRGRHTTDPAHMPKAHQRHLEWTPSRLIDWARTIGPQTAALVQAILADRPHPEQGYRSCLGILRLAVLGRCAWVRPSP